MTQKSVSEQILDKLAEETLKDQKFAGIEKDLDTLLKATKLDKNKIMTLLKKRQDEASGT